MEIRPLAEEDLGYAMFSWREGHKKSPEAHRLPWAYYKDTYGHLFTTILNDASTIKLGAYEGGKLIGWLVATPGKRVHTLHWIHVKHELDGEKLRRRGAMMALLEAADLGDKFIYTLHARRDRSVLPDGTRTRTLDESLVAALRARGTTATYVAMKEWIK